MRVYLVGMKIAVIGPQFPDSFADNILDSLNQMGHEGIAVGAIYPLATRKVGGTAVDLARRFTPLELALQRRTARRIAATGAELAITAEAAFLPPIVDEIRKRGTKLALWFPDHAVNLGRMLMMIAEYDAVFFKEPALVDRLKAMLDIPVHYLPEACNPRWHRPLDGTARSGTVVVAGNLHPYRVRQLEILARAGIPLELYGPPLPRWLKGSSISHLHTGRYIAREDKARVFRAASVVLNQMHPGEFRGMNCRLFEGTACGGPVVTERRDELPSLFSPEREVLAYDSLAEAIELITEMLEDPERGRSLGDAASKRAHSEHTYRHRLERMLSEVM